MKELIQESLEAELDNQLGYEKYEKNDEIDNSRNDYSKKKVKSSFGEIELDIPRDRNSEFEPKIIPKYSRNISKLSLCMNQECLQGILINLLKTFIISLF